MDTMLSILTSNAAGDYNPDIETNILQLPLRCEELRMFNLNILELQYVDQCYLAVANNADIS